MLRYEDFKLDSSSIKFDSNGFLKIPRVNATRVGIRKYTRMDGKVIHELRPEEEVFKPESLETLKMVPINIEHMVDGQAKLMTARGAGRNSVGSTGEKLDREGDFVTIPISITDEKGIKAITEQNKDNISAAYNCDTEWTSGTHKGERYDCIQRNIKYNSLTLTAKGRMEGCRIRLDSGDAILDEEAQATNQPDKEVKIMTVAIHKVPAYTIGATKFDSETVEIPKEVSPQFESLLTKLALFDAEAGKAQAKFDSMDTDLKEAQEKTAKFDSWIDPARLNEEVNEKAKVLAYAKDFKLDSDTDSMTANEIKKALIKKVAGTAEEKFDSAGYLEGAWDSLEPKLKKEVKGTKLDSNHYANQEEYSI